MHNQNDPRNPYNRQPNQPDYTTQQQGDRTTIQDDRQTASDYQVINQTPNAANGSPVSPVDESYRAGYVRGRVADRYAQDDLVRARESESTTNGFLIGILLTSVVGIVLAAFYFIYQQSQAPAPVVPVPVPEQSNPPEPQNNTQIRERVIERTRELVPVPVPQAPETDQPSAPEPSAVEPSPVQPEPQPSASISPEAQIEPTTPVTPVSPEAPSPAPQGAAQ